MITRFTLFILAAALAVAGSACRSPKTKAPKENPNMALELEGNFKQRWIDKRAAELTATGTETTAARTQAEKEFRESFSYLRAAEPGRR